ncbi:hypothetical protein [Peloplasma aerotolerans]|uniref:Uncharacterized protein n=1 Tax=Peloplasma aerotolerans TaxID=3044389 RepID=A0AAW6U725_9MOLU|nr:hypothetical protein [Mariniplasma sp. M4Ah]MDI6452369.1 hypothetical protein [Mariniplasma sp. M4Ah]
MNTRVYISIKNLKLEISENDAFEHKLVNNFSFSVAIIFNWLTITVLQNKIV